MRDIARNRSPDFSIHTQRIRDFFLARQPILNREQELYAYELLFRNAASGPANVTDDVAATAAVIAHASELGLANVLGTSIGFINVDATVLMSEFIHFLPKHNVVLEILETVKASDGVAARVKELADAGFVFALDDVIGKSSDVDKLLPLVQFVKIDICGVRSSDLEHVARQFKCEKKLLLAEKVETTEQYQRCLDFGFDYFQGYYFATPTVLSGKGLSPSQVAIMQLMALFAAEADWDDIERCIKQDASLGLTLLRMANSQGTQPANSSASSNLHSVGSLRQALSSLGRQQMQRWLQILLYAGSGRLGGTSSPLLRMATTRGKLLELIAEKVHPGNRHTADMAFTVGVMSLTHALLGLPMGKIVEQFVVADEVREALLSRTGIFGSMLALAECIERVEKSEGQVGPLLQRLGLTAEDLNAVQLAAFAWSETMSRNAA